MNTSILPKKYRFKDEEEKLFTKWQEEKSYYFEPDKLSDIDNLFVIDTPPPYTNAAWHIGGAIHYSQIDMIARTMRMFNKHVHFPMGLDRNGIPIEIATEKEFNVDMHNIDRDEFLKLCKQLLDKFGTQILDVAFKLGLSCNSFSWEDVYKTDHPDFRMLTQATFIEMWNKGLIYEDDRPNNWDYKLQTTVADAEIEYQEGQHDLYEIMFEIKETKEYQSFATTRPELIPAIRIVLFHPNDVRFKHLEGLSARIPMWNIEVPIKSHTMVDQEFGTGLVQICSYGDIQDVRIIREMQIEPIYAIDLQGKMTKKTGKYSELSIEDARKQIVEDLTSIGVIKQTSSIPYRYPISERSTTPIEFIGMKEYYLKQEFIIEILREYADRIEFHPPNSKEIWLNWLNKISIDWPISRRRFYGTEVPIWYCKDCDNQMVPEPGKYYQPWKEDAPFSICSNCSGSDFIGEVRTFDTWMDSSITSLFISKYPNNKLNKEFFSKILSRKYIVDLRPQGKDIVRTWFHYSMLRIHHLYNKPSFKHAWISGHVVTDTGEKMSKSKGNSLDLNYILQTYGGDALRLYGAIEASHGSDLRFSEERLKGIGKFLTKLYNLAKFIGNFEFNYSEDLHVKITNNTDLWILNLIDQLIDDCLAGFKNFDFNPAAKKIRFFTTEIFSSHYLEMIKARVYNRDGTFSVDEQTSAIYSLNRCLDVILRLLAPITPFMTDFIYRRLFQKSIHHKIFPKTIMNEDQFSQYYLGLTDKVIDFNKKIWKMKKDRNLSLRTSLTNITIPNDLKAFTTDLITMHNLI